MKRILTSLLLCGVLVAKAQDPAYPPAPAAPSSIVAAEYFIDTDPGFGNGTSIATGAATDLPAVLASINTTSLTNGIHRLYIRTLGSDNHWSHTGIHEFLVNFDPAYPSAPAGITDIVAGEYFIDTDPGIGNATPLLTGTGQDLADVLVPLNTTGLSNGVHRFGIRTKNVDGGWSLTNVRDFLIDDDFAYPPPPTAPGYITYAEYFFDTDPGFGNGTSITLTPGVDLNNLSFVANTSTLSDGPHTLFIRSLDDWSITNYTSFLKGTALPLDFISFSAAGNGEDVLLTWQTENETNTGFFAIEWSRNGRDFIKIAEQQAASIPGVHSYQYLHLSPGSGRSYYRLRQVDRDGTFRYSNTVAVNMDRTQKILAYPNPAVDFIVLKNTTVAELASISIVDINGRELLKTAVVADLRFDISQLPKGAYFLRVYKKDGRVESIPFIKIEQ